MEPDAGELLARWRLGILDAAELDQLQRILRDPQRAAAVADDIRFDYAMRDGLRQHAASQQRIPVWRPRARRWWLTLAAGIAALLLLAIGLWPARAAPGTWEVATGSVQLAGDGAAIQQGTRIPDGRTLLVANGPDAALRRSDGTVVQVAAGTTARLAADGIVLRSGAVACNVVPQGSGGRFAITTDRAVVTVHGTVFSVGADAEATAVSVDAGAVAVERLVDGSAVQLSAGRGTLVRATGPLADVGSAPGPDWSDRRPVALVRLWAAVDTTGNPRSYAHVPAQTDLATPTGRAAFRAALADEGAELAGRLVRAGCQAALIWDVEGHQAGSIMYVGDPTRLGDLAPEMDAAIDPYVAALAAAGLRTGVLLRPERLERGADGAWRQQPIVDHGAHLAAKAAYAHRRWGCTLFFLNSAVLPGRRLAPDAVAAVQAAVPGALVICEHPGPTDWGRAGGWSIAPTAAMDGDLALRHPGAIRVVYQPSGSERGIVDPRHDVLLREVADLAP